MSYASLNLTPLLGAIYGAGIYCSPNLELAMAYARSGSRARVQYGQPPMPQSYLQLSPRVELAKLEVERLRKLFQQCTPANSSTYHQAIIEAEQRLGQVKLKLQHAQQHLLSTSRQTDTDLASAADSSDLVLQLVFVCEMIPKHVVKAHGSASSSVWVAQEDAILPRLLLVFGQDSRLPLRTTSSSSRPAETTATTLSHNVKSSIQAALSLQSYE
jgi:hypothetical protein